MPVFSTTQLLANLCIEAEGAREKFATTGQTNNFYAEPSWWADVGFQNFFIFIFEQCNSILYRTDMHVLRIFSKRFAYHNLFSIFLRNFSHSSSALKVIVLPYATFFNIFFVNISVDMKAFCINSKFSVYSNLQLIRFFCTF